MQTVTKLPPNARVVNPVKFGIGPPAAARRQKGYGIPETYVHTPQLEDFDPEDVWDKPTGTVPNGQRWGCAWTDAIADKPGKRTQYTIAPLRVFKNHKKARQFQKRVSSDPKYAHRPLIIFKLGQWMTLPLASWLEKCPESERVEYNHKHIVRLMHFDRKSTLIKREVMTRRSKVIINDDDDHDNDDNDDKSDSGSSEKPPLRRHVTAKEETALLEGDGGDNVVVVDDEQKPGKAWQIPSEILSKKYIYGLMWSLPDVQKAGIKFEAVTFVWHGVYTENERVDEAQRAIKERYPHWNVNKFRLGEPLEMPVPTWLIHADAKCVYDQLMLDQFTSRFEPPEQLKEPPVLDKTPDVTRLLDSIVAPPSITDEHDDDDDNDALIPVTSKKYEIVSKVTTTMGGNAVSTMTSYKTQPTVVSSDESEQQQQIEGGVSDCH